MIHPDLLVWIWFTPRPYRRRPVTKKLSLFIRPLRYIHTISIVNLLVYLSGNEIAGCYHNETDR
jgi:hypothetical protein